MLVSFLVEIGPTAPKPIAGYIDLDKGPGPDIYLRKAMTYSSQGALSTFGGPTEFDNSDFDLRHYKRRCALFNELRSSGNSRFSGDASFL
jgi:hypothetical protein